MKPGLASSVASVVPWRVRACVFRSKVPSGRNILRSLTYFRLILRSERSKMRALDETFNLAGGRLQTRRPFMSDKFTGGTFHHTLRTEPQNTLLGP
jgi:hypothetical protein